MLREQPQHTAVDPSAPATLAGAPSAGPPLGPADPNLTNLGPSQAPYGSNEGKETRRTSCPTLVIQQMVCDQQLNGLSSSADRFIKSNQQMLLSRSAGTDLSFSVFC
ncbi:hypothetical protein F511_44885 [Dorcoceras hygrometricum]|uniref:Uncharacterized protein n=1 Tax=Dorcoceras hygrometricum TaxID=472368 RepID=A0A2Z7BWW1_9LAMI|nr:hypothetical protein F511_44885 [Dorcoceras hygrometricum]